MEIANKGVLLSQNEDGREIFVDDIVYRIAQRCSNKETVTVLLARLAAVDWDTLCKEAEIAQHAFLCVHCRTEKDERTFQTVLADFVITTTKCTQDYVFICPTCADKAKFTVSCVFCHEECKSFKEIEEFVCGKCSRFIEEVNNSNSRARVLNLPATLAIAQWRQTLKHFQYRCAYCGGKHQCLEHYIPLSLGGGTTWNNCLPACQKCNHRKKNKAPVAFQHLFSSENLEQINAFFEATKLAASSHIANQGVKLD